MTAKTKELSNRPIVKRFEIDAKYVIFHIGAESSEFTHEYWFNLDQCNTHEKLTKWLLHLSEKNWFSIEAARSLIMGVCRQCDLEMYDM